MTERERILHYVLKQAIRRFDIESKKDGER